MNLQKATNQPSSSTASVMSAELIRTRTAPLQKEITMKITAAKRFIPGFAMTIAGAAIALAPIAGADTSPLVPYGTNPQVQTPYGLHTSDQDEVSTTNGIVDLPF
jgi:hypothetical protein